MSEIVLKETISAIKKNGYAVVHEPTTGGGANIIALCESLQKNNINYQTDCIIVCQELSEMAALMCYIVLSLIGCSAVIKIADTLEDPFTTYKNEVIKGANLWITPFFYINKCWYKC